MKIGGFEVLGAPRTWTADELGSIARSLYAVDAIVDREFDTRFRPRHPRLPDLIAQFTRIAACDLPLRCTRCTGRERRMTWMLADRPTIVDTCHRFQMHVTAANMLEAACDLFAPEAGDDPEPSLQKNSSRAVAEGGR